MGVGGGLYMYDVVVKKFSFAISSPDEFFYCQWVSANLSSVHATRVHGPCSRPVNTAREHG